MTHEIRIPLEAAQVAMSADPKQVDIRPVLACIQIDIKRKRINAADGFRLASMAWEPVDIPDDWPDELVIPVNEVIFICKQAKRGEKTFGLTYDPSTHVVQLSVLGKTGMIQQQTAHLLLTFPDVSQIYPTAQPDDAFWIDPTYIINIMQAYKKSGASAVRIERRSKGENATFVGKSADGSVIHHMLMTMTADGEKGYGKEMGVNISPLPQGSHEIHDFSQAAD